MGYPETLEEREIMSGVPASWFGDEYAAVDALREQMIGEDWV